jgi:hypothetical protein
MKINDIVKEETQAVITNYQPGKSVEVAMPDGTQIKKDLTKEPGAITKDEQGNPIFNMMAQPGQAGTMGQPAEKPITTGMPIGIITDPSKLPTLEAQDEEDAEEDDLIGSGEDGDIGDDATDSFINQVVDREYERSSRGSISPRGGQAVRNVLPEGDELYKWLTIAGLK